MTPMRLLRRCWFVLLTPALAVGATPRLDDYARGMTVGDAGRPIVELAVPDAVYRTTVTDDLSDVRVFNADGVPVPHALCVAPTQAAPTSSQQPLPVYRVQDVPQPRGDGTRVEVQTPSGAQISVAGEASSPSGPQTTAFVIDARQVEDELRAVQFDWSSPDGASEVRVSIQASEDLDRWRTLVARTTLVDARAERDGQALRRQRVELPQARYRYLRVERVDRGPPLQLDEVIAEGVTVAPLEEPTWVMAVPTHTASRDVVFDAERRAPVRYARLSPPEENMSLQVAIESRADEDAPWSTRWSGEVYSFWSETEHRVSPPAQFPVVTHRHWRVRLIEPGQELRAPPALELGYRPALLRFLTQGEGPYTLAFGSRRAEPAVPRDCDRLLGDLSAAELERNIGDGHAGFERELGGEQAFRPLPKPTPVRQIVLWAVLVIGAGVLIAMALSLLRRLKPDGSASS
jgi:hypothetical protein